MFRLFQLIKNKSFLLLPAVLLFCLQLGGAAFSPEWNFDRQKQEKGRIMRMTEHFPQGDVVHVYDAKGRKILRTFPDKDTRKKVEYRMTYDNFNRLLQVSCFVDGKLVFIEKGTYDAEGILRAVVRYNAADKEEFSTTMIVYEQNNRRLKSYGIQSAGGIVDYYYEYNSKGELVHIKAMLDRKYVSGGRYSYDKNGLIIEVLRFNDRMKNVGILRNEWKVDKFGNWIEKKSALYKNMRLKPVFTETVKRTIRYRK